MMELVDYNYRCGLYLEVSSFSTDGKDLKELQVFTSKSLEFPVVDTLALQARVQRAIKNAYTSKTLSNGHLLRYGIIPSVVGGGDLTVINPGWGADFEHPLSERDLIAYGATDPTMNFLFYNAPGVGGSSPLPGHLSKDLARTGIYKDVGTYLTTAMHGPLRDYAHVDLVGESQGARHALGIAASESIRIPIRDVRLLDPVGSKEQSLLRLAYSFAIVEGGRGGRYSASSTDEESRRIQKDLDSPEHFAEKISGLLRSGVLDTLRQIRALCHGTVGEDLRAALPQISRFLQVNTPELSALTSPKTMPTILAELAKEQQWPASIEHRILRHRSHSCTAGNPAVRAAILMDTD